LRSTAELKPYHAGAQYMIFAMTVALKTSWSDDFGEAVMSQYSQREEHKVSDMI